MIIGSEIHFFENLPSTNSSAFDILKERNVREGTVIHTHYQLAGKGQVGNSWESEPGKNLLFSIILFPEIIEPTDQFYISMAISLGICDFLKKYSGKYSVKWPNDIYMADDKIAGILIENSITGNCIENSVIGIGININQEKFQSNAPNPVSLKMATGKSLDITTCLNQLLSVLDKKYKYLIAGNMKRIKEEYVSNLYRLNKWHFYSDMNGRFKGRITGIDSSGRLLIEKESKKTASYGFKEVDYII